MSKKTLGKTRGGKISRIMIFGGIIIILPLLSWGGIFLFSKQARAGGEAGGVIDYTLLEKLQAQYGTTSESVLRELHRPQISATKIEHQETATAAPAGIEIFNEGRATASPAAADKIWQIIFLAFAIIILGGAFWLGRRRNGNNSETPDNWHQGKLL